MEREPHAQTTTRPAGRPAGRPAAPRAAWVPPRVEVVSLSCEITSYAPDDDPLF